MRMNFLLCSLAVVRSADNKEFRGQEPQPAPVQFSTDLPSYTLYQSTFFLNNVVSLFSQFKSITCYNDTQA